MREDIKKAWIARLEANTDKQGIGAMCRINADGECFMCCLGVLADIIQTDFPHIFAGAEVCFDDDPSMPGGKAMSVGGMLGTIPLAIWEGPIGGKEDQSFYYNMNDSGEKTFPEIAAEIAARE